MKKLLLLGLFSLILISCREDDSDKRVTPNVLPEATQNGANTGGALVDGKVWVSSTKRVFNNLHPGAVYLLSSGNNINLSLSMIHPIENSEISFEIEDVQSLMINKKYYFDETLRDDNDTYKLWGGYKKNLNVGEEGRLYPVMSNGTGYITITKINIYERYISGVFEFVTVNEKGDVVVVTKGRFDKKF